MAFNLANGVWEDYQIATMARAGGTAPSFANFNATGIYKWQFTTTNDELHFQNIQLPHAWIAGTTLRPHIHFTLPALANTGSITWEFHYMYADVSAVWSAATTLTVPVAAPFAALTTYPASFGNISIAGGHASMLMSARLKMTANTTGQNPFLDALDIHYQVGRQGTVAEFGPN